MTQFTLNLSRQSLSASFGLLFYYVYMFYAALSLSSGICVCAGHGCKPRRQCPVLIYPLQMISGFQYPTMHSAWFAYIIGTHSLCPPSQRLTRATLEIAYLTSLRLDAEGP